VFALDEIGELLQRIQARQDAVKNVRAVETAEINLGIFKAQQALDIGTGTQIGGGRQRQTRHLRELFGEHRQTEIVGAEVVAPLAHAMRFVDRKQAEQSALEQRIHLRQKTAIGHALGGRVQQGDFAAQQTPLDVAGFFAGEGGVEEGGIHTRLVQRTHLVVHQCDQRRDHDGDAEASALACDGRDLVAQRFASTRGHQHQRIAPGRHMVDDGLLRAAKGVVAKNFAQDGEVGRHCGWMAF